MAVLQRPADFFDAEEISYLREISPWRTIWALVHCWGVILLTWIAVAIWTNPLTILLGILVIGARQLGLFILSHDGAHGLLFKDRKLNDWVCEWFLNRSILGGTIDAYRKYHLKHHANTQQEDDPDLNLSKPFPISKASWRRKVWRDLSGQTGIKQYGETLREGFKGDSIGEILTNGWRRFHGNIVINAVFLVGFAFAGKWYLYFLLWWVPALTWNRFITRLRNIGEHAAVPDNDDRLRNTRTIEASWWERAFIAPYGVSYHLEHHLIVNCPYYKLRDAHRMLLDKGLREKMEVRASYRDMLAVTVPG